MIKCFYFNLKKKDYVKKGEKLLRMVEKVVKMLSEEIIKNKIKNNKKIRHRINFNTKKNVN